MKAQTSFRNRHGEHIIMTYDGKDTVTMVGGEFFKLLDFSRTAEDNDGNIIMFDPPGGPCIYGMAYWEPGNTHKTSMDLGKIDPVFKGLHVSNIEINNVAEVVKIKIIKQDETGKPITDKLRIKESGTEEGS